MPTAVPTLTDAPDVPDRTDRSTFSARCFNFDNWRKFFNVPELRAAMANVFTNATEVFGNAAAANASAVSAAASAAAAATSTGAATWVSGTTYPVNAKVTSPANGRIYFRRVAGAGTTDPSADPTNWSLLLVGLIPVIVSTTSVTASAGFVYILTNAALTTVTLPAGPLAGDTVGVMAQNGRTDNNILRNGSLLMVDKSTGAGLAEDMTYDTPWVSPTLTFTNGIWRLI